MKWYLFFSLFTSFDMYFNLIIIVNETLGRHSVGARDGEDGEGSVAAAATEGRVLPRGALRHIRRRRFLRRQSLN